MSAMPISSGRRRIRLFHFWLISVAAVLNVTGCDNSAATVSGTVTLDGQPIEGGPRMYGTVTFYRENGGGTPAVGVIDDAGYYSVKTGANTNIEPGQYQVAIAVRKITVPDDPNAMPIPTSVTPTKYKSTQSSGLRADVKPGTNSFDFALVSDGDN